VPLRHPGGILPLVRQGLTLEFEFGTRAIEALIAVAQTIEESVYERGSLRWTGEGLWFALDNPPLRVGAFASVRVLVDGVAVPAERIRLRPGDGAAWRAAATVTPGWTYDLGPGDRTEFWIVGSPPATPRPIRVRVELRTESIPPPVWCEVHDTPSLPEGPG
jgi:hypothetical protein